MKKLTTLRLDESLMSAIMIIAQKKKSTVTDVITEAIISFLRDHSINDRLPIHAYIKHQGFYLKSGLQSNEIILGQEPIVFDINSIDQVIWVVKMGFEIIPKTTK